jgi:predicted aspartyl protease
VNDTALLHKVVLKPVTLGIFMGLLLMCSCATSPEPATVVPAGELPDEVAMNENAGRGMWLFVTLHLEDGEEAPCFVDTGANVTLLDSSLVPKLGKRLRIETAHHLATRFKSASDAAPKLYLGNTRLMMGETVFISDLKYLSFIAGRPVKGILGMDCLKHYCLQLDFEAGKIRFLEPDGLDATKLGRAFPLHLPWGSPRIHQPGLAGGNNVDTLIDTGWLHDDGLGEMAPTLKRDSGSMHLPECVWEGYTYTNLAVTVTDHALYGKDDSILGLEFLARHLVTFNFPKRTMYLKQTRVGPLADEGFRTAMEFLHNLNLKGQQPGWKKEDEGDLAWPEVSPTTFTFRLVKHGNPAIYHYMVAKAAKDEPCKLLKAWRTDSTGHTVEEYSVP